MLSVILPSRGRPAQLRRCIDRLLETTQGRAVECVVILDGDDTASHEAIESLDGKVMVLNVVNSTPVDCWNIGAALSSGDALMLAADDLWWSDGWLDEAAQKIAGGFVGLNDGHTVASYATHYIASRQLLLERFGGVLAPPCYQSQFVDVEMCARAQRYGVYQYAEKALVEHRHWLWHEAEKDATYERCISFFERDKATFAEREAAGFPNDYQAVLA